MRFARNAHRRDANAKDILAILRDCGFSVLDLSQVGDGAPDALVGRNGYELLIEIKTEKGALEDSQLQWMERWRGVPVLIARSAAEVLAVFDSFVQRERRRTYA